MKPHGTDSNFTHPTTTDGQVYGQSKGFRSEVSKDGNKLPVTAGQLIKLTQENIPARVVLDNLSLTKPTTGQRRLTCIYTQLPSTRHTGSSNRDSMATIRQQPYTTTVHGFKVLVLTNFSALVGDLVKTIWRWRGSGKQEDWEVFGLGKSFFKVLLCRRHISRF